MSLAWSYSAIKDYENCPRKWNEVRRLKRFKDTSFAQSTGLDVHKHFEDAVDKGTPFPPAYAHYQKYVDKLLAIPGVKYPEYEMAFNERMEPRGWFDKDVWLRSAADLLIVDDKKPTAFTVDYKTGKSKYADTTQLKLVAICTFTLFPTVHKVKAALMFPHEEKFIQAEYVREKKQYYWEPFMATYAQMTRAVEKDTFPERPSGLCGSCPVSTCVHYKGR